MIAFVPFLGIAPFRYRDIFQKSNRKNPDGSAKRWYENTERPMIAAAAPSYLDLEQFELGLLVGRLEPKAADDHDDSSSDRP
jgi:hypothetical protein